jgi:hypothetical protein
LQAKVIRLHKDTLRITVQETREDSAGETIGKGGIKDERIL